MTIQKPAKRLVIRWTTLKGLAAIILFIIVAAMIEYAVVLYALNLGVQEKPENLLQWSFQFPGTGWIVTIAISPLFNLIPVAVIIALVSSWTYLTRRVAIKPYEIQKGKPGPFKVGKKQRLREVKKFFDKTKSKLLRTKAVAYLGQRIHFARATIKSALTVLLVFSALILLVSLLAYPQLTYQTISNGYQNNPALLNFVRGTAGALTSVGGTFSAINDALLSAAPGFRGFVSSIATIFTPMVGLDDAEKYLVFQNAAAWVSALVALFYGEYMRKGYRQKIRKG